MKNLTITDVRSIPGDSAFLIDDGETAVMYDSGFAFTGYAVADRIKACLGERPLDYIFLSHSHYDHALGSVYAKRYWPDAKVVAGEYAAGIFAKPTAKAVMRELDGSFAAKCGVESYEDLIDELSVDIPAKDGDVIEAGSMKFTVINLPGHTKCSVGYFFEENRLLLGSETIGVYDGEESVTPAFLIGYNTALQSIQKARSLDIEYAVSPHYGLLDRKQTAFYLENGEKSTVETAEKIASILRGGGSKDDAIAYFKSRFYRGYTTKVYPEDAMLLNTAIMIGIIEKELLSSSEV